MERFTIHDSHDFFSVTELRDILDEWLTGPGSFTGLQVGLVESGNGDHFRRIVLFSERLTDGSYVFGVRFS
jgi:hypothetical protein